MPKPNQLWPKMPIKNIRNRKSLKVDVFSPTVNLPLDAMLKTLQETNEL